MSMLQGILRQKGLALESDESVPAEGVQVDEVALGQEIEEVHDNADEIVASDEAVASLESLVATLESCGGAKTALEKHLAMSQAAMLYKTMGLSAPSVASLESAEFTEISLEGWKETATKVVEAIKAAWAKVVSFVRDLWVKLTDTAGRLSKKLKSQASTTDKTTVSFKALRPIRAASGDTLGDGDIDKFEKDTKAALAELGAVSQKFYSTIRVKVDSYKNGFLHSRHNVSYDQEGVSDEEFKELKDNPVYTTSDVWMNNWGLDNGPTKPVGYTILNVKETAAKLASALDDVSKYHRDWQARVKIADEATKILEKTITDAFNKYAEESGEEVRYVKAAASLYAKLIRSGTAYVSKAGARFSHRAISIASAFSKAL